MTLAALVAACGGSGTPDESDEPLDGEPISAGVDLVDSNAAPSAYQYCSRVPVSSRVVTQRQVRDYGATPDDDRDDTAAIQRALDAANSGETVLFAPGRYLINHSIRLRRAGVTVLGPGATIHATNPDDQALLIEADNTTVASLTFTAVTDGRRSAARHARIAVYRESGPSTYRPVYNTVIRDNKIINAGAPGTPTANSASAGGIMILRANGFLISGNTVARTLADGIHITAGSRNGRVLNNVVREVGDDMIAIVSYAAPGENKSASAMLQEWDARSETSLVRNVLISGNRVSGQYWGRGISLVGAHGVSISHNTISNVPLGAAVLVAREAGWQTFGVDNVVIENNLIREVQTQAPGYDYKSIFATHPRTGHGAIELHAALYSDEAASPLRERLAVHNVVVRNNSIERTAVSAARLGVGMTETMYSADASGNRVARSAVNGLVRNVSFVNNVFNQVKGNAMSVLSTDLANTGLHCSANQRDGAAYSVSACKPSTPPSATGAPLNCSADGLLM